MNTITLSIEGMTCGHCIGAVSSALATIPDVEVAEVTLGRAVLHASATNEAQVASAAASAVTAAGYPARVVSNAAHGAQLTSTSAAPASCCANTSEMHGIIRARS